MGKKWETFLMNFVKHLIYTKHKYLIINVFKKNKTRYNVAYAKLLLKIGTEKWIFDIIEIIFI